MASEWSWRDEDGRWHIDIDASWDAVDAEEEAYLVSFILETEQRHPKARLDGITEEAPDA